MMSKNCQFLEMIVCYNDDDYVMGIHPGIINTSYDGDFDGDEMSLFIWGYNHNNPSSFYLVVDVMDQNTQKFMFTEQNGNP